MPEYREALNRICERCCNYESCLGLDCADRQEIELLIEGFEKLKIEYEPKWIPCSERLPKDEGDYLVTCNGRHNRFVEIVQFRFERFMICQDLCEVIAWYDEPLPPAYKGE